MSTEEKKVDLLLKWEDKESLETRGKEDVFEPGMEEKEPAGEERIEALCSTEPIGESDTEGDTGNEGVEGDKGKEKPPEEPVGDDESETGENEPSPDDFVWKEDLDNAIDEALRQANESPLPRVHSQLDLIRRGVEKDELDGESVFLLLNQVDEYLEAGIKRRNNVRPSSSENLEKSRSLVLDGLKAYSEASRLLRAFVTSRDNLDMEASQKFCDQAAEFILEATDIILEMEPGIEE